MSAPTRVAIHGQQVLWTAGRAIYRGDASGKGPARKLAEVSGAITGPWLYGVGKYAYVRTEYRVVRVPIAGGKAEPWLPVMPEAVFDLGPAGLAWAGGAPYISTSQPSLEEGVRLVENMDERRVRLLGPLVDDVAAVGIGKDTVAWLAAGEFRYQPKPHHPALLMERPLGRAAKSKR